MLSIMLRIECRQCRIATEGLETIVPDTYNAGRERGSRVSNMGFRSIESAEAYFNRCVSGIEMGFSNRCASDIEIGLPSNHSAPAC